MSVPQLPIVLILVKITFIIVPSQRTFSLECDATHISINKSIAQTECTCQFFAPQ